MTPSLFVNIICFKDPDVVNTVCDLFNKAYDPKRITVGVVLQEDEQELYRYKLLERIPNVKLIVHPTSWAEGSGKARFEGIKLYEGENYYFQTDAHMRFDQDWEEMLIKELKQCKAQRPIITTLPPGFDPSTGKKETPAYNKLILKNFFRHIPIHVGKRTEISKYEAADSPQRTPFLAGGVIFATGGICGIKPDPYFYYLGEEITFNLRLWTRGFANFLPRFNFCYHEYRHRNFNRVTFRDYLLSVDPSKESFLHERSMSRYQVLMNLKHKDEVPVEHLIDFERYDFGAARTVRDWEDAYGIWIREEKVNPEVYSG